MKPKIFKPKRAIPIISGCIIILLICFGIIYFITKRFSNNLVENFEVSVVRGDITSSFNTNGTVKYIQQYNAGFDVISKITNIYSNIGDKVFKGQRLAKIDTIDLEIHVKNAEANLSTAKDQITILHQHYYNSDQNNTVYKNKEAAELRLNQANQALVNATLIAPFDGIVIAVNNKVGDTIIATGSNYSTDADSKLKSIITIADASSEQIELQLNEDDISNLSLNKFANITFSSIAEKIYTGKITKIDSYPTQTTNSIYYIAKVSIDNLDEKVKAGKNANVNIILNSKKNTLYLPISAVKTEGSERFVQLKKDQKISKVIVKTGLVSDQQIEIIDGLSEGDTVVSNFLSNFTSTSNPFGTPSN